MSHEKTITVGMNGRHFVIPSVVGGIEDADEAVRQLRAGKLRPFGQFTNENEANEYARNRSLKFRMTHDHNE